MGGVALAGVVASQQRPTLLASASGSAGPAAGSWSADHHDLSKLAARPEPPRVPQGWEATWDGLAHRYYFYNQATKETSWDLPERVPARVEPGIYSKQEVYKKLTWGAQRPQAAAAAADAHQGAMRRQGSKLQQEQQQASSSSGGGGQDGAPGSSSVNAVIAYWQQRGKQEMQQAKDAGFAAAVSDSYDDYDLAKGRAMHKTFKGAPGGGEGYWPADPPYFPKPGEVEQQGLQAAIDANYDEYDMAHGIADHKIFKDDAAGAAGNSGWHAAYHHGLS